MEENKKKKKKSSFPLWGNRKENIPCFSSPEGVFVSLLFFIPTFFFFLWKKQRQTKPKENEKVGKKKENDTKGERNFVSLRPSSREEKVPEGEGKKKGNEKKSWEKKLKENEEIKRNNHNGAFF